MSAPEPADSHLAALKWLLNRSGDGVFGERSNHTVLLAGGDRAPVMRGTWSALERLGLVAASRNQHEKA